MWRLKFCATVWHISHLAGDMWDEWLASYENKRAIFIAETYSFLRSMFKEINVFLQSLFIQKNQFFCPRGGTLGFPACIHIRNFKSKKVSTASKFVVCGKNLDLIKLGAYKSSTGRQTRSNRSQISQGQACQIQREKNVSWNYEAATAFKVLLISQFIFFVINPVKSI